MVNAQGIRDYCKRNYVDPARARGEFGVIIRAGDVHDALGLSNRLPAVSAAIGADTFPRDSRLKRVSVEGPLNGANTYFTFLFREALER